MRISDWSSDVCSSDLVPRFGDSPVDPEIAASVHVAAQRIAKLGHIVEEGEVPFDFEAINENLTTLFCTGLAWLLEKRRWEGKINGSLVPMLEAGTRISGAAYLETLSKVWRLDRKSTRLNSSH